MSIRPSIYVLSCNTEGCGEKQPFSGSEAAAKWARDNGWRTEHRPRGDHHVCPKCLKAEAAAAVVERRSS